MANRGGYIAGSALAIVLLACGSGTSSDESKSSEPNTQQDKPLNAQAVEKAFIANLGGQPISSMCDRDETRMHWGCFYEGVESPGTYLRVKLSTDAGIDGDALADTAGRHWFNFVHCDFPDLDTIVVSVNGIDHNVFLSDTNAASMPC